MSSDFRLCKLIDRGIFPAIGADILLRGSVAVDIAVSRRGHRTELYRDRHANFLGDGKEARAVLHSVACLTAGSNHRIPAAFGGGGNAKPGEGRNSHGNANRRRLITHSGTSLNFVEHFQVQIGHKRNSFLAIAVLIPSTRLNNSSIHQAKRSLCTRVILLSIPSNTQNLRRSKVYADLSAEPHWLLVESISDTQKILACIQVAEYNNL